jgi:hypothetical protein
MIFTSGSKTKNKKIRVKSAYRLISIMKAFSLHFKNAVFQHMKRVAIVGGGPSGLFVFKRFVEANTQDVEIEIFEKKEALGVGMPYSTDGAGEEHVTNVSGNEIPELETSLLPWINALPPETLNRFKIDPDNFSDYKVIPRLLFGQYLSDQFKMLERKARKAGMSVMIHRGTLVTDIIDDAKQHAVKVITDDNEIFIFQRVVICTGHHWPVSNEGKVPGYFDSPYPPAKISMTINHPVAIRGSSLTAVDAVRSLAKYNGKFISSDSGKISFRINDESKGFKMVLHSRSGLLPAIRFHLNDSHLGKNTILSDEEIKENKSLNDGFLSLDYVFEKNFKALLKDKDAEFYKKIQPMKMEEFVETIMELRESVDSFDLFKGEYIEADKSIDRRQSVYWKEMLGVLSYTMNYPAKYFSAEDMLRLNKILKPLISIVIAYAPQTSVEEMLALHEAGLLEVIGVGEDSYVEPGVDGGATYHYVDPTGQKISMPYQTYIDATGQPALSFSSLPYKSLLNEKTVSQAKIKFRDPENAIKEKTAGNQNVIIDQNGYYLNVPGIAINDNFQVLDEFGAYNERIFMMAVPFISGYNPDYSGLDFCEISSKRVVQTIVEKSGLSVDAMEKNTH